MRSTGAALVGKDQIVIRVHLKQALGWIRASKRRRQLRGRLAGASADFEDRAGVSMSRWDEDVVHFDRSSRRNAFFDWQRSAFDYIGQPRYMTGNWSRRGGYVPRRCGAAGDQDDQNRERSPFGRETAGFMPKTSVHGTP
jgi:hypothetical protein